ncbi:MAG: MFS transporter [Bacteroidota bacterium]|nr:MFS transporter [Bacteroidota bacterium]
METLSASRKPLVSAEEEIRWKQLWSLAALYASIIIGWIAYQNYQPKLLLQFQFTDFTFSLIFVQGLIVTITPIIAGRLGDRYRFQQGHRLPIISTGISFAAMVFMAVAFTLLGNPGEVFKWVLPVLIVLWLVAMSIFTSPALSTMELFTPVDKLPRAMAILTITGNLVYALEPVIVDIIDYLGAPVTFMVGGVVVFLSGYALKKNSLGLFRQSGDQERGAHESEMLKSPYLFIFFIGLSVGVATTFLFDWFPLLPGQKLGAALDTTGTFIVVGILIFSAIISWPMGNVVNRHGLNRSFWISLSAIALSALAMYLTSATVPLFLLTVVFGIAYTSISVASLPLAINRAAFSQKVFCVGIFFSGAALPQGVWEAWAAYSS